MRFNLRTFLIVITLLCIIGAGVRFLAVSKENYRQRIQSDRVRMALAQFSTQLHYYVTAHAPKEWATLDDAVAEIYGSGNLDDQSDFLFGKPPQIANGIDPWGSKIVLVKGSKENRWILRSFGPNGRDDGGEGDDIDVELWIRFGS